MTAPPSPAMPPAAPARADAPPLAGAAPDAAMLSDALRAASSLAQSVHAQPRLNVDPANVRRGLGQLVLTLVKLLHELLERQAIRRIEGGGLTDQQVEDLGTTLMLQAQEIRRLQQEFALSDADLNLDLGPLGRLLRD